MHGIPDNFVKRLIFNTAKSFGFYIGSHPPTADRLQAHLTNLIPYFGINCVIDVGAHHGEFGNHIRECGYSGKLISFEPVSGSFGILKETSINDSNWEIYQQALGNVDGKSEINLSHQSVLNSFLLPSDYGKSELGKKIENCAKEIVEVRKLDSILDDLLNISNPNIFLKLDTQGFDVEVLNGAKSSLSHVNILQTELPVKALYEGTPNYLDTIKNLNKLGFELSGLFPITLDKEMRLIEMDCVMIKSNTQ